MIYFVLKMFLNFKTSKPTRTVDSLSPHETKDSEYTSLFLLSENFFSIMRKLTTTCKYNKDTAAIHYENKQLGKGSPIINVWAEGGGRMFHVFGQFRDNPFTFCLLRFLIRVKIYKITSSYRLVEKL